MKVCCDVETLGKTLDRPGLEPVASILLAKQSIKKKKKKKNQLKHNVQKLGMVGACIVRQCDPAQKEIARHFLFFFFFAAAEELS